MSSIKAVAIGNIGRSKGLATSKSAKSINLTSILLTALIIIAALLWLFPLYWAVATSVKTEQATVGPLQLWPASLSLDTYWKVFTTTNIVTWYFNSVCVSLIITFAILAISVCCAYALSQLRFPGRKLLLGMMVACVMVPMEALIVNHFVLMNAFGFINTWQGIILPQLVAPAAVIIFKQFFDQIPKDYREAAMLDNAGHFKILFSIYLPMNLGVITAIGITTFIAAWNNFLWPFLVATSQSTMTIPVGITQVHDTYGIHFASDMAMAVLAGLPVAVLYLVFQRRITNAIMLSAGIKG
jgi:multiple sugar transport system permease protein